MLKVMTNTLDIEVDPLAASKGDLHLGDAKYVKFHAKHAFDVTFEGDKLFDVDSLTLAKDQEKTCRVVGTGACFCRYKGKAPGDPEVVIGP